MDAIFGISTKNRSRYNFEIFQNRKKDFYDVVANVLSTLTYWESSVFHEIDTKSLRIMSRIHSSHLFQFGLKMSGLGFAMAAFMADLQAQNSYYH